MKLKTALVQMSAGADKEANVAKARGMVERAARKGARFVLLPEVFSFVADASLWREAAETIPGPTSRRLAALARKLRIHLLAGSILESSYVGGDPCVPPLVVSRSSRRKEGPHMGGPLQEKRDRCSNTSLLIAPSGRVVGRYRKMHLFTVRLPDGVVFDEIDHTAPGERPAVAKTPFGRVGLTICYDARFPELYRALMLMGADIVTVPSAFTAFTGRAHWEVLLRARAIENQVFVLAPNQVGTSATGVEFYGHSLVVDPWGTVLAEGSEREEIVFAEIDTARIREVRGRLLALRHVRRDILDRLSGLHRRR